jgi:hypothetical protein
MWKMSQINARKGFLMREIIRHMIDTPCKIGKIEYHMMSGDITQPWDPALVLP